MAQVISDGVKGDLTTFKIYRGELKEFELNMIKAFVGWGIQPDTDARRLFLSLSKSLESFVPCQGTSVVKFF